MAKSLIETKVQTECKKKHRIIDIHAKEKQHNRKKIDVERVEKKKKLRPKNQQKQLNWNFYSFASPHSENIWFG